MREEEIIERSSRNDVVFGNDFVEGHSVDGGHQGFKGRGVLRSWRPVQQVKNDIQDRRRIWDLDGQIDHLVVSPHSQTLNVVSSFSVFADGTTYLVVARRSSLFRILMRLQETAKSVWRCALQDLGMNIK
jgi:hypothetical protein